MPERRKKSKKKKKSRDRDDGIKKSKKTNYKVIEEPGEITVGKQSYGEEPGCCACDSKRCLNGRCGVCWLPILGLLIATGFCALLYFSGVIGFSFETDGSDTLWAALNTDEPTANPTSSPTSDPTFNPTVSPTDDPTADPTVAPTISPTSEPTSSPTYEPTNAPTDEPTLDPTGTPTIEPTSAPTNEPTLEPSASPTVEPTSAPTDEPSTEPTSQPTGEPSAEPTAVPTVPTYEPTNAPTNEPTMEPTAAPSVEPTSAPTDEPTSEPTSQPTVEPTADPTAEPTVPTDEPTNTPTNEPTLEPTASPTVEPTSAPTAEPTSEPTSDPTSERRRGYNVGLSPNLLFLMLNSKGDQSFEATPHVGEFLKTGYVLKNFSLNSIEGSDGALVDDANKLACLLRSAGYTNYHYGNCLGESSSCHNTFGQGWDYWYTALDHTGRKDSVGTCFWQRRRGKCIAQPRKTFQSKTYVQCLASCHEFEAVIFEDVYFNCQCFDDAAECSAFFDKSGISDNDFQSDRVEYFWLRNEDISAKKNESITTFIGEKVLSDILTVDDEMWMMTVSLTKPDSLHKLPINPIDNPVYDVCNTYGGRSNHDHGRDVNCLWRMEFDWNFGEMLEALKVSSLWDHTIVMLVIPGEKENLLAVNGGALPAEFLNRVDTDYRSLVDVVPVMLEFGAFSEPEFENLKQNSHLTSARTNGPKDTHIKRMSE